MKIGSKGSEVEIDVFGDTDPKKVPASMFHGALSIDYASAVRADISKQAPATCPRYWYIPAVFQCVACKEDFAFSVDEQRFWYEERKFIPGVTPASRESSRMPTAPKPRFANRSRAASTRPRFTSSASLPPSAGRPGFRTRFLAFLDAMPAKLIDRSINYESAERSEQ